MERHHVCLMGTDDLKELFFIQNIVDKPDRKRQGWGEIRHGVVWIVLTTKVWVA